MVWQVQNAMEKHLSSSSELATRCLGRGWGRAALEEALASPIGRLLVACERAASGEGSDPPLRGFLIGRRVAEIAEIDGLGVADEVRRRGCAASLVRAFIACEAAAGAEEVRLELRASNSAARRLYTGLGFVVVGRRNRYYPDGEEAWLLTRRLSRAIPPLVSTES